jgi:hypothetical protein
MEKIKYDTIPSDALIDIQISGSFYKKLVSLLTALGESVPQEEFKEALAKLKTDEPVKNIFELNIHLLISIIYELEKKAVEQKKTKEVEIDAEPTKDVDSTQPLT